MINALPCPWYDIIVCKMSEYCYKFQKHYLKDINICYTNKCVICQSYGRTHMHHIIPRGELGSHSFKNIIELCPSCHIKAEKGIINISNKGQYFYWGLKKKHKFLLKLYKNNINLTYNKYNEEIFKNLIRKHLSLDSAIKYLIKFQQYERIEILKEDWKKEGIIK
jgi:hypothetical protein